MSLNRKLKAAVLAMPFLLLSLFVLAVVALHTRAFSQFVLTEIMEGAERSTGARIEIQSLKLAWSPFRADLFGITVHGTERKTEAALFQCERLSVSLSLRGLLKHRADLYSLTLERPIVNVRINAVGESNLPSAPSSSSSNFDVRVRHASLRDGVLRFNDRETPLAAEIDGLNVNAAYDAASGMYRGEAAYRSGEIATRNLRPITHKARVQFAANRSVLELDRLEIDSGRSQIELSAHITNFTEPEMDGHYQGRIAASDMANVLRSGSLPRGMVALSGTLHYKNDRKLSFLRAVRLQGRMDTPDLEARVQSIVTPIRNIRAAYRLSDAEFTLTNLSAAIFGGRLSGQAVLSHLDGTPSGNVRASLKNVSLETLSDALPANSRQNAHVLGQMNLDVQAQWTKDISALNAKSHIDISGPETLPAAGTRALPVNGTIQVSYNAPENRASFGNSKLRVAHTTLTLNGEVSRTSQLNVDLAAPDLHELSLLVSAFAGNKGSSPAAGSQASASSYDLRGAAHLTGQVSGAIRDPRIQGQLSATNLQVKGGEWRSLRVNLSANSSGVQLKNGNLEGSQQGQITFDGRAALRDWSYAPGNPITVNANLTKLSLTDLERLAGAQYPVTGNLSGSVAISGSQVQPVGHGSLELAKGSAWNEPIRQLKLDFKGSPDSVQSTAELQLDAGRTNATLTYEPKIQQYQVKMTTSGLRLDQLRNMQRAGGSVTGILSANIAGEGTIADPHLSANAEIPDLQIAGQSFSGSTAQIEIAQKRAEITVNSVVQQGFVHAKGKVELREPYSTNAAVDVRALPIGPLLASHSSRTGIAQDLQGYTEVHASISGPLKDPARLEGYIEIPRLNFAYHGIEVANDAPWRIRYDNGVATLEQARMKGTGTDLSLQGVIPIQSPIPLNASAKGQIDAKLLQLVSPDIHSSGKVEFDLRAAGGLRNPETQGTIRIVNTSLGMEDAPLTISNMNGQLSVAGNRLQIDTLQATSGSGTLSASGSATFGTATNFALGMHAEEVRAVADGIRSTLNADLQLNGSPQKSQLKGQIVVDRLSFQDGFDLSTFVGQVSGDSTVSSPSPFASNMQLGVSVRSSESLNLASSQLSIAGGATLTVTGTAANPVILGRVNLTNGELFFQNKRFEVQNGTIVFSNPTRTEPVVNLYVKTVVEQYNITINFAGPLDRLKTNYTSDPSLPPLDIINLLAFGQTTAEKASNASTPASLGAESVVAQGVSGQVAKGVQNLTGISQLTIDPTAGTSQNPGAQVAIQQRVTGSILMTFSTDVTSTQRQTVQLQYQPKPQWKISVLRDAYGGYGIDIRLHKNF